MTVREAIYSIVRELYPGMTLDERDEPDSVLVYEENVEYKGAGELVPVVHYGDVRAIADKRSIWKVHFYSDEYEEWAEFEKAVAKLDRWRLEDPERAVRVRLLSKRIESFSPLWETVFELEVIDQVYEEALC